ncbi:MAG: hypothetical protein KKD69_01950 [Euryarchaeota archaeon]|nr:hypothetical protein [Euryarchaeota archaeon]
MEGQAMNGKKLMNAAEIISKAGEQIEALVEILNEKLIDALTDEKQKIRAKECTDEGVNSAGDWMFKSYFWDIALLRGKSKKPYAHVAIQIVLYDEEEVQIQGWEPSIYIMYATGEGEFELESFCFRFSKLLDAECHLDGDRLWRWEEEAEEDDSWMFSIPLVKMNCEEDLVQQIVEPVKKLIAGNTPHDAFPSDSVAFRFAVGNDDKLSILVEDKP